MEYGEAAREQGRAVRKHGRASREYIDEMIVSAGAKRAAAESASGHVLPSVRTYIELIAQSDPMTDTGRKSEWPQDRERVYEECSGSRIHMKYSP